MRLIKSVFSSQFSVNKLTTVIHVLTSLLIIAVLTLTFDCAKEPEVIKIGVITTLTGMSARYGQSAMNGIHMAVEEINIKGGIKGKKIKLIIEDDASEPGRAVSAFKKLASIDRVPIIIGPISSSAAMACSPLANQFEVVLFSPSAATPNFTTPNDYTFRNRVSSGFEISELAKVAYEKLKLRKIAILYVNNDWGFGCEKYFNRAFKEIGGTILITEAFDEGATDLRSHLSKVDKLEPDGIFVVGQGSEGGYALRQAHELGIKTQFLSALSIQRTDVIEIAGESANGVIYAAPSYDPYLFKETDKFEKKYMQKYHQNSDLFSGNGYDAVYIIANAIEIGGYTADGIRDALFNIKDYEGVTGKTSFDKNGDVMKPICIKKIESGKFIYFNESLSGNK